MIIFFYSTDHHFKYFNDLAESINNPTKLMPLRLRKYRFTARLPKQCNKTETVDALKVGVDFRIKEKLSTKNGLFTRFVFPYKRKLIYARSVHTYCYCRDILVTEKPRAICVWNGEKYYDSIAVQAAIDCGIPILRFENGVLPDSTTIDARGINARNSAPRDPAFYYALMPMASELLPSTLLPRAPLPGRTFRSTSNELPERFLFLPFQVDRDTQIINNSPWIKDMRHFFSEAESALEASGESSLHLVFREHPSSPSSYPELHDQARRHGRMHFVNDRPLGELIEKCEAVVTINSTVGIEALLLGRKVMSLGDAFYNIPGLVWHAETKQALHEALAGALTAFAPDDRLRRSFLTYLLTSYVIPGDWRKPNATHLRAAERRIWELIASSDSQASEQSWQ